MLDVITWNVLHRVHAENWGEDVAQHWADESERIAAITALLAQRDERVIALQEVSGDQLAALRRELTDRTVHAFRYPRVPASRTGGTPLEDPSEHLVLLVGGTSAEIAAEAFEDDPGKGALVVEVDGVYVVATHVSGDGRQAGQLARLAKLASAAPGGRAVVLGDFNADRDTVAAGLGAEWAVAKLPADALPTRPASEWIDHVVVRGAVVERAMVESAGGLSDHHLVRACVVVGT